MCAGPDVEKKDVVVGRAADRSRRAVHVDRPRRRRGLIRGQRTELVRSGLRLGAARAMPKCSAAHKKVIDRCWAMGDANPILLIHDVGAGGLSNALPEAIAHSRRGGRIDLRKIPSAESRIVADGDLVQ